MAISFNDITDSLVLIGSQFSEPMRVIGNPTGGDGFNLNATRETTVPQIEVESPCTTPCSSPSCGLNAE